MKPAPGKFESKSICNFSKTTFLLTLALLFIVQFTIAQQVITVDNRANSGADYTSLSAAVAAAFIGDTIQIHPSATNYGSATLNKRTILVGLSHNPANSKYGDRALISVITFTASASNSIVTGLDVNTINTGGGITDVKIVNNKIIGINTAPTADNWVIEGNIFQNGYIVSTQTTNGWIVKNNIFYRGGDIMHNFNNTMSFLNNIVIQPGGNFAYNCANPIVNNNIFILQGTHVDVGLNNSAIVFNNNLTYNVQGFPVNALSGNNNLDNTNPQFVNAPFVSILDYYNNDYNVTNVSAINGGTDGTDLGIFGGNFLFDVQGRPDLFPYMTSLNIINSSVEIGQSINVEFTAKKKN